MSALDRQVVIALGEQIAILKAENAALVRDLGQARAEHDQFADELSLALGFEVGHPMPRSLLANVRMLAAERGQAVALRGAAGALLDGLRGTITLHWPECDESRGHHWEDCDLIPMQQISWDGRVDDVCDACAARLLEGAPEPPVCVGDLPHAAPLRALRKLLGRVG